MAVISFLISIHHTDTVKAKIGHSSFAFVYHVHLNIPSAWHNDFNKWSNNETYLPILAAVSSYEPQNVTALSSFPMSQVTFDPPVTKALWPRARITIDRRGGKGPSQVSLNNSTIKPSCREKCLVFMWFFFQSLNVSLFIRMQHIPAHLSWARMERARSEKTKGGGVLRRQKARTTPQSHKRCTCWQLSTQHACTLILVFCKSFTILSPERSGSSYYVSLLQKSTSFTTQHSPSYKLGRCSVKRKYFVKSVKYIHL